MFLKLVPAAIAGSFAIGGASMVVPALGQARVGVSAIARACITDTPTAAPASTPSLATSVFNI